MSFLGERNAIALGVSQHAVLGSGPLLTQLSPSLLLQFAGAQTLDPRITFTRSTTATYYDQSGVLSTAAINAPRFDYNPATLAPLGLLIEEQRTNLILQSETCDVTPWVTAAPYSVNANAAISPDGTQNADALIVANGSSSFTTNVTKQVVTKAASAIQYTRSGYFKALGLTTTVRLNDFAVSGANSATVVVSLIDGSIVSAAAATGTFSGASVAVTNVGNGWWRVALTYTTDTTASLTVRSFPYVGASTPLTGDGTSGLLVYGTQLEAGAFATSYIPTVASQVTRTADVATMTGTNFSSWYNATEGTFFVDWTAGQDTVFINAFAVGTTVVGESASVRRGSLGNMSAAFTNSGVVQANMVLITGEPIVGTTYKAATAYQVNNFAAGLNGVITATDASGTVPLNISTLVIGSGWNSTTGSSATEFLNSTIRQIVYYPRRLSNAQLQGITS